LEEHLITIHGVATLMIYESQEAMPDTPQRSHRLLRHSPTQAQFKETSCKLQS